MVTLCNEGVLDLDDLKLYYLPEYDVDDSPWAPTPGILAEFIDITWSFMIGFFDFPVGTMRALRFKSSDNVN